MPNPPTTTLYVLYDHTCQLCTRAAPWLRVQPAFCDIKPIPARSQIAAQRFPDLAPELNDPRTPPPELIAITDTGQVYRGLSAWLICLYSLKRHRLLAHKLARPAWRPLARRAVQLLSEHRYCISRMLDPRDPTYQSNPAACADGHCITPRTSPQQAPWTPLNAS